MIGRGETHLAFLVSIFGTSLGSLSLWYINLAPSHTHNSWLLFSPPCRHWFVKKTFFITFWRKTFDCNWPKSLLTYNFSVIQLWSRRPGLLIVMNVLRLLSERSRKSIECLFAAGTNPSTFDRNHPRRTAAGLLAKRFWPFKDNDDSPGADARLVQTP